MSEYTMQGSVIEEDGKFYAVMKITDDEAYDDFLTATWAVKDLKKEIQENLSTADEILLQALESNIANGHYICLYSPNDDNKYGAFISAGRISAHRQCLTPIYYHRNPVEAIGIAVKDHQRQCNKKGINCGS